MSEKGNFEKNMEQLEQITKELEKGELNLDESVTKFEEGMKLSKACTEMLEDAEKRISILIQKEEDIVEEDFDTKE